MQATAIETSLADSPSDLEHTTIGTFAPTTIPPNVHPPRYLAVFNNTLPASIAGTISMSA